MTRDVKNSYLKSDGRLIVALGIKDLILVETIDSILVSNKNSINNLKKILQESEKVFDEINLNKTVYRFWGKFTLLTGNKNWQIKKIEVYLKNVFLFSYIDLDQSIGLWLRELLKSK